MFAYVRYQLISYLQSFRIIPPAALYFIWVFILYAYKNVPILSSYGASSVAIYLAATWMTMSMFTLEEESEKHILFFYLESKVKYLIGKWLTLLVLTLPLLVFAIFFPVVSNSFRGNMSFEIYILAIYSHIGFAFFGILVGTLFSATALSSKKYAWLSAALVIVLSISSKSVLEIAPFYKWISWVFPPVFQVIEHMEGGSEILLKERMVVDVIHVLTYCFVLAMGLVYLFRKKES